MNLIFPEENQIQCWFTKIKPNAKLILWRKLSHRAFQKLHHGLEAEKVFNWKTYQIPTLNQLSCHKCENQAMVKTWRLKEPGTGSKESSLFPAFLASSPTGFILKIWSKICIIWQDYDWWKNLCSQQIAKSRKRVRAALKMSSVRMTLMIILWHKNNMITLMWCYDNWQMFL